MGNLEFRAGSSLDIRPNLQMNLNANAILTCKRDQKVCSFSGSQTVTYSQVMSTLDKSKTKIYGLFRKNISFQEITKLKNQVMVVLGEI